MRAIAVSSNGSVLFCGGFFDGILYAVDMNTNRVTDKIFVGKEIRAMIVAGDGKVIVGNEFGLMEVDAVHRRGN